MLLARAGHKRGREASGHLKELPSILTHAVSDGWSICVTGSFRAFLMVEFEDAA